jgi:hypothetical protein
LGFSTLGAEEKSTPSHITQSFCQIARGLEKGGFTAQLQEAGCTDVATLYWSDEMRIGLMGQVRQIWAPRGIKVRQAVEYQREWAYLDLAVNGLAGKLLWNWTGNMKGESIAPVVKGWGEKGAATVVWDRAPGHRGEAYLDVQVKLIEQPPYSPELNPAERVFEYLRGKVEGKVYGTLIAKMKTVEVELDKLAADPERVKSLAGWDWICQSIEKLPILTMALA